MTAMTDFSKDAKIFKALCDTKRLTILDYLKSGEKCACVLIENMNIGQSALSYHMKILCDSGIVHARQEGKWTYYSLSKSGSEYASKRLLELTTPNTENQSRRRSFTERNLSNRHGKKGAHLKNYMETFVRNNTCIIEQMFV